MILDCFWRRKRVIKENASLMFADLGFIPKFTAHYSHKILSNTNTLRFVLIKLNVWM